MAQNLGEYLRSEREKSGISLEQIASATKISVRFLHALERDQFEELPAKPFVRGFLISYCRYLNLNPNDLLTRYGVYLEEKTKEPSDKPLSEGFLFDRKEGDRSHLTLWIVLGAFILLGGGAMFILKPVLKSKKMAALQVLQSTKAPEKPVPAVESPPISSAPAVVVQSTPPVVTPPQQTVVAAPKKLASMEPTRQPMPTDPLNKGDSLLPDEIHYKIVVRAKADVVVRYQVDQRGSSRMVLQKDKILVLRATQEIRLQVSNPKSAEVRIKGTQYFPMDGREGLPDRPVLANLVIPSPTEEVLKNPFPSVPALATTPDPDGAQNVNQSTP